MAIKKIKVMFGSECYYWKITGVSEDRFSGSTTCFISLYKDEITRRENIFNYIFTQAYSFPGVKLTDKELYVLVKTQQDFLNSEDI